MSAMSLHPHVIAPVPDETARVARAAFPTGNPYLLLRDTLGTIFRDDDFATCFPLDGQPGLPPWRLALVTIMQFRENLADRQAAEAVRARIDWKYLLGLALTDPGFDFSVLSEFRDRLLASSAEELLLDQLLERCRAMGWLKVRGAQRTDSTHVLAAIRVLNRLELVAETLRAALNAVATVAPAWLQGFAPLAWYERYGKRIEDTRLPQGQASRDAYAQMVGEDGFHFLDAMAAPDTPQEVRALPILESLRRTWQRHYERTVEEASAEGGSATHRVRFKANGELPPAAESIESPYDADARYRHKRDTSWTGYMVHVSEPCEPTAPHLLTHVHTTPATVHEAQCTTPIQQALLDKELPPREHFVDAAYISAELLVQSHDEQGITLRGPTRPRQGWQQQVTGAYTLEQFTVDWEQQQVSCPQGKRSGSWQEHVTPDGHPSILVSFRRQDCHACPTRPLCTQSRQHMRRLRLPPREQYEALAAARSWYGSEEGIERYKQRAGVEGTLSQGVRAFELRRTRYRGLPKTHMQHVAIAAAINVDRIVAWLDERPRATTRTSRFAALAPAGALNPDEAAA
jgi:transposase